MIVEIFVHRNLVLPKMLKIRDHIHVDGQWILHHVDKMMKTDKLR